MAAQDSSVPPKPASEPRERHVPRITLAPAEAAEALGVSRDFFDAHVMPELRVVRRGRRRLVPVRELERWVASEAGYAVGDERRR